MHLESISIKVSDKIKNLDHVVIENYQVIILQNIHQEFFPGLKDVKFFLGFTHQLSLECVVLKIDIISDSLPEKIVESCLFLVNFSSERHQLQIMSLMFIELETAIFPPEYFDDEPGVAKYLFSSSKFIWQIAIFSTNLTVAIRVLLSINYLNEDKKSEIIINYPVWDIVLIGTKEPDTGKLFYFPAKISEPA